MHDDLKKELSSAIAAIAGSKSSKKVVVAGPGAGKTYLFRQLLEQGQGGPDARLVLTFINNLKGDLERDLGAQASVYTFHSYCRRLLHQHQGLRAPLTQEFHYFPGLPSLIRADWEAVFDEAAPHYVGFIRDLTFNEELDFYITRSNYYDAVSFDDSVFRVHTGLQSSPGLMERFELLLVDEYQDFNRLEVEFLRQLAGVSPIVVAGDDDQALYSQLRSARAQFIRDLFEGGEYDRFQLPFCMRCTQPIVEAVADIVRQATRIGVLSGRIDKPYKYFPPKKAADTERYQKIKVVETTVQRLGGANYFGRYIEQEIRKIPEEEIRESEEGHFPTVLIIGPGQYLRQIRAHLESDGFGCQVSDGEDPSQIDRDEGIRILQADQRANLGWRIVLEVDKPAFLKDVLAQSVAEEQPLVDLVSEDYRDRILREVAAHTEPEEAEEEAVPAENTQQLHIKLVSYEGSKGLSAQHVFIVGLHNGELPRNPDNISDLEVCKFLVALTRTRKQCHLLHTQRWSGLQKRPSRFLSWIGDGLVERITVNQAYWN